MKPLCNASTASVDDVARRIEIRFADFEMNDIAALCFQRLRFHQHFERGLGAETRHARRETKFLALSHHGEISIIRAATQLVLTSHVESIIGTRLS